MTALEIYLRVIDVQMEVIRPRLEPSAQRPTKTQVRVLFGAVEGLLLELRRQGVIK